MTIEKGVAIVNFDSLLKPVSRTPKPIAFTVLLTHRYIFIYIDIYLYISMNPPTRDGGMGGFSEGVITSRTSRGQRCIYTPSP